MRRKIAVTGMKPDGLPHLAHGVKAEESIALHAPTALLAEFAGQHVHDGVDVGRDVKAPPEQIVAGVDDDGQVFGADEVAKSVDEFGAAGAAG
jgi:hypothetical protein